MPTDLKASPTPTAPALPKAAAPAPAARPVAPKRPGIAADSVSLSEKAETQPSAAPSMLPGETIRNNVSLAGSVAAPLVTAKQSVNMLASASFRQTFLQKAANLAVGLANKVGALKIFANKGFQKSFNGVGKALPWLGAGVLAFDGVSAAKTLTDDKASTKRKTLTGFRFLFNALGTGLSFIPRVGMVLGIPAGLIGNVFEIWTARMNAKGEK